MSLSRGDRLRVLQEAYQEWTTMYPNENDDDADSHLDEIQKAALARAEGKSLS